MTSLLHRRTSPFCWALLISKSTVSRPLCRLSMKHALHSTGFSEFLFTSWARRWRLLHNRECPLRFTYVLDSYQWDNWDAWDARKHVGRLGQTRPYPHPQPPSVRPLRSMTRQRGLLRPDNLQVSYNASLPTAAG